MMAHNDDAGHDTAYDIAIVGAGMAGASLAAALADAPAAPRVALIEAEAHPGYHATGRSAAFWNESYGGPGVVPLTTASGPELRSLGVLEARGALTLARAEQAAELAAYIARFSALGVRVEPCDRAAISAHLPGLAPAWVAGALEPDCCDIDVAALHQHYLARARQGGVTLLSAAGVMGAARHRAGWQLKLAGTALAGGRGITAEVLVNTAGAWADALAALAGVEKLGIQPYRRTIAQVRTAPPPPPKLPLVLDIAGGFYFKPEGDRLWLSPHDETPSPPCDAAPEEIDVAIAIARLGEVVDWRVERVEHRWAGLRSFAPDRLPVYGFDARVPGFFWFAAQGGFGIQTAPAAARLGAALLLRDGNGGDGAIDPAPYAPTRFG